MQAKRWFWLYRPVAPSVRAQSIQVVNAAHAMATLGRDVTLAVEPAEPGVTAADVLAFYGLDPLPTLHLHVLSGRRTVASVAYRALFAAWIARGGGVALARSKRHAAWALDLFESHFTLVVEAHEVDSAIARDREQPHEALFALERRVIGGAAGVVANCEGTLDLLGETHALPAAIALHNAAHPDRHPPPHPRALGAGYVGSVRSYKDLDTLARAARLTEVPITVVGARPDDPATDQLRDRSDGRLILEPPIPYHAVPERLSRFKVLVLPLSDGLFGQRLTSPLKLWDALASRVPIVGADVEALRRAAPGAFLPYQPGDPADLARAINTAHAQPGDSPAAARVRSWRDRAIELARFVETLPA